jgi:predicted Zn-dependent protease
MYSTKLIITLLTVFLISCDSLRPFFLSDTEEITMGDKFKAQITTDQTNYPPFRGDAKVGIYIDYLGQRLASVQKDWRSSSLKFTFTIIDDDTMVNAFAVPGGHVFVYTGLLLAAENEAQVAGVLAHEIGHITKHHSANMLVQQNMLGFVNDVLFGNDSSSLSAITSLLEGLTFLRFSRENEYEADSCAVSYTALAGMNPSGLSKFLTILKTKYGDIPRILEPVENAVSSHPPLSKRIENVNELVKKNKKADTSIDPNTAKYLTIKNLL